MPTQLEPQSQPESQQDAAISANSRNGAPMRIVIVGHVDHGKSTLIGRMLYDTNSLPEGKFEQIEKICNDRGVPLEFSYLLDAFQAERDQAITIDTTQIWFKTALRDYVIIDAPGHREFLKNMISGAAAADAAILVVDGDEGIQEQTRRHAYLLHLLGLRQIIVAVNKMDKIGYNQDRFDQVSADITAYLAQIGVTPSFIVPISARQGDMIAQNSAQNPAQNPAQDSNGDNKMPWYQGGTLLQLLDQFQSRPSYDALPLRFPIQDVYRHDEKRILVGRIESGVLHLGQDLLFSPGNETAKVTSIEAWPEPQNGDGPQSLSAGDAAAITLDKPLFVERGHIASALDTPPMLSNVFRTHLFWLSHAPLKIGNVYTLRYGPCQAKVTVQSIERVINTDDLDNNSSHDQVERNAVAEVTFRARRQLAIDPYADNPHMGRAVFYDGYDIAGGGILSMDGYADQRRDIVPKAQNITKVSHLLCPEQRYQRNGHRGGVIWLTGLSGSGKSTLAMLTERALFDKGCQVFVLDGDNIRHGLNSDLGFSPKDRAENIRRIGEVAALMARAGMIVITAFISPYQADRDLARNAAGDDFHEIYIKADLKTCESRDPKGLYKKARSGKITQFTGIDAPYETPITPDLVIDTTSTPPNDNVTQILTYLQDLIDV